MTDLLEMLHDERAALARKLAGIDAAISALNGSGAPAKKTSRMSAEVRAKISAAAKRRWAKIKGTSKKRTMSAEARAKISKAAKARWAKVKR
jgi:Fe-S cluster assembly scaffold protein SufB